MKPDDFIKTIYLGDRCLKCICLRLWDRCIDLQVDLISRVRSADGDWHFYDKEDIPNGKIVLSNVQSFALEPAGLMPNGLIENFSAHLKKDNSYLIVMGVESIKEDGTLGFVELSVVASTVHLESPTEPTLQITT